MRKSKNIGFIFAITLALGLLFATVPTFAHHAFAAEYDAKNPVTLTGTVTIVQWTNPHAHFFISVKDASGTTSVWDFELGSPNGLMRKGWTRNSLKPGDTITAMGYPAKDHSKLASARSVSLPDGRKIFAGTAEDGGPVN